LTALKYSVPLNIPFELLKCQKSWYFYYAWT